MLASVAYIETSIALEILRTLILIFFINSRYPYRAINFKVNIKKKQIKVNLTIKRIMTARNNQVGK